MEKNHINYPEILANILDRKFSKCICPKKFMRSPGRNKTGCRFGPDCKFSQKCNYEQSKCTCVLECTCSTDSGLSEPKCTCTETCNCKSDLDDDDCTCIGICNCNSSEIEIIRPPSQCNKNVCTCKSCLCQSIYPSSKLLPNYFRDTVKKEYQKEHKYKTKLLSDKLINQELEEMKQLMEAHKQINEEFDQIKFNVPSENTMKVSPIQKTPSIKESSKSLIPDDKKEKQDSTTGPKFDTEFFEKKDDIFNNMHNMLSTVMSCLENDSGTNTQCKKYPKKKQTCKPNYKTDNFMRKKPSMHKYTSKPMRIRYYYSGGTEHYGVKLGHKHCMESTAVHNMPWQLKTNENSTNNGGRGPPGHIRKSVKNMINVMKNSVQKKGGKSSKHSLDTKLSDGKIAKIDDSECKEEPPLIHIHKKGRTYHVTFCPKESDPDIKPIPIPFVFTKKKEDSDTDSTESTLEFELHSPKPQKPLEDKETQSLKENTKDLSSPPPTEHSITGAHMTTHTAALNATEFTNDTRLKKRDKDIINKSVPNIDSMTADALNDKRNKKKDKFNKLMSMSSIGPNNNELSVAKKSKTKEKDKFNKVKSAGSQENKILWEEHQTQMQNVN